MIAVRPRQRVARVICFLVVGVSCLDTEVTPRFPDGLTLFKGHGRFTGDNGVLVKEEPFVVNLLYPFEHFKSSDKKIEEIRRRYKAQLSQESVLRVDYHVSVRVSF